MKTYTTKIAKNGATLYYSVETGKRIAKETALENERNYIIANGTAAERYELAKEEYRINEHGKIEKLGYHRVIRTCCGGYYYDEKYEWHTVNDSSADTDLQKDYALTLEQFRAEVEAENAIEIKREKIISTPLVTAEAMEVAVDAEIELANANEPFAKVRSLFDEMKDFNFLCVYAKKGITRYDPNTNFDNHALCKLVVKMIDKVIASEIAGRADGYTALRFANDTERRCGSLLQFAVDNDDPACKWNVLITHDLNSINFNRRAVEYFTNWLLTKASFKYDAALYFETVGGNVEDYLLPIQNKSTEETAEVEEATVKDDDTATEPTEKELIEAEMRSVAEERDKFIGELEEAEANPEIAQSHIDYLKSEIDELGDRYQELWAQLDAINTAEVIAEDDGSNDDADDQNDVFKYLPTIESLNDVDTNQTKDEMKAAADQMGLMQLNRKIADLEEQLIDNRLAATAVLNEITDDTTFAEQKEIERRYFEHAAISDALIDEKAIYNAAKFTRLTQIAAIKNLMSKSETATVEESKISDAQPQDKFTAELTKLQAAANDAYATFIKAQDAHEQAKNTLKNFLNDTAFKLKQKLDALPLDYTITLKKTGGSTYRVVDFSEIYIGAYHIGCDVEFRFENWAGRRIVHYDTPAQVEQVIAMLKAAIERGDTEFTFPTIEQLNTPTNSTDAEISDSLTRAMQTAEYNVQTYRRHNNPDGMRYEMELYSICADALNELKRRVA